MNTYSKNSISLFSSWIFFTVLSLFSLMPVHAVFAQSLIGSWNLDVRIGGTSIPQTWNIVTHNTTTGAISGGGAGNSHAWTFTGTASGGIISMDFVYTTLPSYFGNLTAEISGTCSFINGTWNAPGQAGDWDGEKKFCTDSGGGNGSAGSKRSTAIKIFCNRFGPSLERASCSAVVGDSGAPPRKTPSGTVSFEASGGFFPSNPSCLVTQTQYSPGVASCLVEFAVPFGFPIATKFPIEALYEGDANFEPSATSHELISVKCVGDQDNPCSGAVALSFSTIPQIAKSKLKGEVVCGGSTKNKNNRQLGPKPSGCLMDLSLELTPETLAKLLAGIEDIKAAQEAFGKAYKGNDKLLKNVSSLFKEMAENESFNNQIKGDAAKIEEALRNGVNSIRLQNVQNSNFIAAAKKRALVLKLGKSKQTLVRNNKQKSLKVVIRKPVRKLLSALKASGQDIIEPTIIMKSKRQGKLPVKGIKRNVTLRSEIAVGLNTK